MLPAFSDIDRGIVTRVVFELGSDIYLRREKQTGIFISSIFFADLKISRRVKLLA